MALVVVLAGCVGKDDSPSALEGAVDKLTGPTEAELRATPGSIQGLVLTASFAPIANARVALLRENVATTTDEAGFFRFAGLANGVYLVSAEAEGYETRTVQASATNGTVYEVELTLAPAPKKTPFVEPREFAGLLSCGIVLESPLGRQSPACSAADPNHRDTFEIDLMPGGAGVVLELVWDPAANPGAPRLRLHAETVGYGAHDEDLGEIMGEGYARLEIPAAVMEKYYPEGGRYRVDVALVAPDAPPAAAAFQMDFTLYATAFYHAAPPAGFTVLG